MSNLFYKSSNKFIYPLITARSGSTEVPNKNLRLYKGQALLERAINKLNVVFGCSNVSSDSTDYLDKARFYGASNTSLVKEKIQAYDDVTLHIKHFIKNTVVTDYDKSVILLLQCTSPNIGICHLFNLKRQLDTITDNEIICSMYKLRNKITALFEYDKSSNSVSRLYDKIQPTVARQLLPDCLALSGAFFAATVNQVINSESSFFENATVKPFIVGESSALDIDSEQDFSTNCK